ncbi:MAG: hypothetical protein JST22_05110 [Bacteroidetes bacterium]|nr:hypothetical protein [Bacteroidota bacterium]
MFRYSAVVVAVLILMGMARCRTFLVREAGRTAGSLAGGSVGTAGG